jgi:hypothetical protein
MEDLDGKEIKEMLFNMQRLNILTLYSSPDSSNNITEDYAYAWHRKVYPYYSSAEWHKPYANLFEIKKNDIEELVNIFMEKIDSNNMVTFYELEDFFGIKGIPGLHYSDEKWTRSRLIKACKYLYLSRHYCDLFDDKFWSCLLTNDECPSEARSITAPFGNPLNYLI